jgi:putrescine aminotransferase
LRATDGLDPRYLASDSGGSPYACATALAAIEYIEHHDLPGRAERVGGALRRGLQRMAERYPKLIVDAQSIGLMTGLTMRNPATETALTMAMGRRGIHVAHSMNETARHPVLRFYPPLTVTEDEIEFVLNALDDSLSELNKKSGLSYDLFNQVVKRLYRIPPAMLYRLTGKKVES